MKTLIADSKTIYVQDDDGREIVTLTVGRVPKVDNTYGVELTVARGDKTAVTLEEIATTKPKDVEVKFAATATPKLTFTHRGGWTA